MTIVKTQKIKSLQQILAQEDHPQFRAIIQQNEQTQMLNKILPAYVDDEIIKHCHIARFANGKMLLIVENAAWATKLRYIIPDLIKKLKVQPEFKTLKKIHYKLQRTILPTTDIRKKTIPSSTKKHASDLNKMAQQLQQQKINSQNKINATK